MAARRTRATVVRALAGAQTAAEARRIARGAGPFADDATAIALGQRFDDLVRSHPRRAAAAARGLAALARVAATPLAKALALRAAGVAAHLEGRPATACKALEGAARLYRRLRLRLDEGDVHRTLIEVLHPTDPAAARRAHARAVDCYGRAGRVDARRKGSLAQNLGNVHHQLDDHAAALAAYGEARRQFARARLPVRIAQADYNRANVLVTLDRTDEARSLYCRAREQFKAAGQASRIAQTDFALAGVDLLEGELDAALARLADVRSRLEELGDRPGIAHADLDAADAFLRANRPAEAAAAARRAEVFFRRAGYGGTRAIALGRLGAAALLEGRPRAAEALYRRAAEAHQKARNRVAAATETTGLAIARARAGDPHGALALARRAASVLAGAGLGPRQGRALAVAADAALAAGRLSAARSLAERALTIARGAADGRVELAALLVASRVALARDDRTRERDLLRRAEDVVERLRTGVTTEQSRLAFALDKSEVYEALVENRLAAGEVREALAFAEKGKARMLAERLAEAHLAGVIGRTPRTRRLLARLADLDRRLAVAEARLDDGGTKGLRGGNTIRREELADERAAALALLERSDPPAATLIGLRLPDPLAATGHLGGDELVLEYCVARGALHLFVVSREGVEVVERIAPLEAVVDRAARLRFHLGKGVLGDEHQAAYGPFVERAARTYLRELFDLLLGQVADRLEGRSLRIVPHGPLHGLPFHAFERDGVPVIERSVVSYVPSLSVLAFDVPVNPVRNSAALVLGVADERAPEIDREIDAVCGALRRTRVFRGEAASRSALALCEERPPILHVASHGWFGDGRSMAGALKLGDAWFSLRDIYSLGATADLVVLSGCDTGRGTVHSGDEWVGLVRGFLQAGARSVVGALWEVHDRSATPLIRRFYQELAEGTPVAAALARAQREARSKDPSPLRWAPFAVVGDPGWTLRTERKVVTCA